jgi:hypothetical protein
MTDTAKELAERLLRAQDVTWPVQSFNVMGEARTLILSQADEIERLKREIGEALAFQREVWGWLESRGLVDPVDPEWDGFVAVIEEHEREIEGNAISTERRAAEAEVTPLRDAMDWIHPLRAKEP